MNWFHHQSRRDQVALLLCGFCIAATLLWTLVLEPLGQAATDAQQRAVVAEQSLVRVKELAQALQRARALAPAKAADHGNLATLVDRSTANAGLKVSSMEPGTDGTTLSVRLDDAQLPQVLRWLHDLERNHARLETLALLPARAPGEVMVNVRMKEL